MRKVREENSSILGHAGNSLIYGANNFLREPRNNNEENIRKKELEARLAKAETEIMRYKNESTYLKKQADKKKKKQEKKEEAKKYIKDNKDKIGDYNSDLTMNGFYKYSKYFKKLPQELVNRPMEAVESKNSDIVKKIEVLKKYADEGWQKDITKEIYDTKLPYVDDTYDAKKYKELYLKKDILDFCKGFDSGNLNKKFYVHNQKTANLIDNIISTIRAMKNKNQQIINDKMNEFSNIGLKMYDIASKEQSNRLFFNNSNNKFKINNFTKNIYNHPMYAQFERKLSWANEEIQNNMKEARQKIKFLLSLDATELYHGK